jgi:hypothetical protein
LAGLLTRGHAFPSRAALRYKSRSYKWMIGVQRPTTELRDNSSDASNVPGAAALDDAIPAWRATTTTESFVGARNRAEALDHLSDAELLRKGSRELSSPSPMR